MLHLGNERGVLRGEFERPRLNASSPARIAAPRYNPARRKTFKATDWGRVVEAAIDEAERFGCAEMADWCRAAGTLPRPAKADQDRLDAVLCTLVALRWRCRPRKDSMMLGDLASGYMVLLVSPAVRERLTDAAERVNVAVDGRLARALQTGDHVGGSG